MCPCNCFRKIVGLLKSIECESYIAMFVKWILLNVTFSVLRPFNNINKKQYLCICLIIDWFIWNMATEHWKTRRIPQVKWIIDEIYNKLAGKAINATRLLKLGDELDKEGLLHMSPPWKTVKEGRMTTREMFQSFKNQSLKSFTTREIYVRWLDDRDRIGKHRLFSRLIDVMCFICIITE